MNHVNFQQFQALTRHSSHDIVVFGDEHGWYVRKGTDLLATDQCEQPRMWSDLDRLINTLKTRFGITSVSVQSKGALDDVVR